MSTAQKQIDQLAQTLKAVFEGNCELEITGHALPDHLIVFQDDDEGNTHQLLLNITYIGQIEDDEEEDDSFCGVGPF